MSLYADKVAVKNTISNFCEIRRCVNCNNYFCELENVGMWKCMYHPGNFDATSGVWSCCGEKVRQPVHVNTYGSVGNSFTWDVHDRFYMREPYSKGCKRRDCVPSKCSGLPKNEILIETIASLIPYMKPTLEARPGLASEPLRLVRQEAFPTSLC